MGGTISLDVTAPASTTEANAVESSVPVGPGTIKSIIAQFPAGCQYLAKLQVSIAGFGHSRMPLLPSQTLGASALRYIALDNDVQEFPVGLKLYWTTMLYARLWNDDSDNQHDIKVIINMEP